MKPTKKMVAARRTVADIERMVKELSPEKGESEPLRRGQWDIARDGHQLPAQEQRESQPA